ncbi:hypothetical protein PAXINDRAFT_15443 [Paxillus involutus ATCC 200175]|uniref:FAD-binding domain-containing protein n=1 Tax=Paxillus involutus ATCC 200175 TaxID=664439 RepID=A0A0C9T7U8_PAXIN|nr:hypothetical protein PAXINDRAFT_15443 [Paxillus involutus ATCC 200175]
MHVLNGLDLARKLLQRDSGIQVPCITINDPAGGLIGKVPLYGSVERYGWSAQVHATEEFDDGIIVHWNEHGLPKHKKVDLLIGADGIWSAARLSMLKSLGLSAPELTYGGLVSMGPWALFSTLTAFLGFGFLSLERACVMIQGRQGFIGMALFDKQGKKVAWWTSLERNGGYRRNKREVRERYSDWAFPVPQLIAAAETSGDQPFVWPVFEMEKLGHWHSKRTVLVGDAAHAIPPHSGQGASQSLEDGFDVEDLMPTPAAFQAGRQPRVNGIIDEANRRDSQNKGHRKLSDGWFGYKVPGIEEWAALRASTST